MAAASTRPDAGEANFTEGDLAHHVARLSSFMILGFLAMTLGQFFEAAYLGILGIDALAAVTFTFPVMMALGAATRGIGAGIGAAAYPGLVISVGSILQDAIGPFFIFGWLGLWALGVGGVEGAAWAFVIARSVSFLLAAHWFVIASG